MAALLMLRVRVDRTHAKGGWRAFTYLEVHEGLKCGLEG